jgi:hypothetical protein
MGHMFSVLFAALSQLFSAFEKGASALNHIATSADEAAGAFADRTRHDRQESIKALLIEAGITEFPKAANAGGTAAVSRITKVTKVKATPAV